MLPTYSHMNHKFSNKSVIVITKEKAVIPLKVSKNETKEDTERQRERKRISCIVIHEWNGSAFAEILMLQELN